MTEALFKVEGDSFVPTELSGGPWHSGTLHGGAPAGLLAYCFERELNDASLQPARLSIDLLRPVPKAPLQVKVIPVRRGKRIALLEAELFSGDRLLAKATALFVKPASISLPNYAPSQSLAVPKPDQLQQESFSEILFSKAQGVPPGLHTTVCMRPITDLKEEGQGSAWLMLPVPVVQGIEGSAFQMVATLSDFGNGVGQLSLGHGMGTINCDVQLQLSRLPVGLWIALDSQTLLEPHGIGQATTTLFDESGRIGQVTQVVMPMGEFTG